MPRRLDQQPASVPRAGLGDVPLAAGVAGAVLRRHQPEVAHQQLGLLKAPKVADLDRQPDLAQRVKSAQAAKPRDVLGPRRAGDQLADRPLERRPADLERLDRTDVLQQRQLRAAL
jgi:hypothetical protein